MTEKHKPETTETDPPKSDGITGTLSVINRENQALAAAGIVTDIGLVFDPNAHYELDEMMDLGRSIAKRSKKDKFYEGDYLIEMKKRFPDAYQTACNLFGRDYGTMRNIVTVCANVPAYRDAGDGTMVQHRSTDPKVTFEHHVEISKFELDEQAELIHVAEVGVEDPISHAVRPLTRDELRATIKKYEAAKKAGEASGEEGEAPEAVAAVAPYVPFEFRFRALGSDAADEKPAAYETVLRTQFDEKLKRHLDPKYAKKATERERKEAFQELLKDVPKDDRAQFATLFESGKTIPQIKSAVKTYEQVKADAAALETALAEIPPSEREQFETMRKEGKPISEIKQAVKDHGKKRTALVEIKEKLKELEGLFPGETEEAKAERTKETAVFLKQHEDGTAGKDVKKNIADRIKIVRAAQTRKNTINKMVETFTDEQKAPFIVMMHEGKSIEEIRAAVRTKRDQITQDSNKAKQGTRDRIKELEVQLAKKCKAINLLQENATEADKASAAMLQRQVDEMNAEKDKLEASLGTVAKPAPAGTLPKPSGQLAGGKGKKGGAKKGGAKKGSSKKGSSKGKGSSDSE